MPAFTPSQQVWTIEGTEVHFKKNLVNHVFILTYTFFNNVRCLLIFLPFLLQKEAINNSLFRYERRRYFSKFIVFPKRSQRLFNKNIYFFLNKKENYELSRRKCIYGTHIIYANANLEFHENKGNKLGCTLSSTQLKLPKWIIAAASGLCKLRPCACVCDNGHYRTVSHSVARPYFTLRLFIQCQRTCLITFIRVMFPRLHSVIVAVWAMENSLKYGMNI